MTNQAVSDPILARFRDAARAAYGSRIDEIGLAAAVTAGEAKEAILAAEDFVATIERITRTSPEIK